MNATVRMAWLVNRLRCMSVPELAYRLRQAAAPGGHQQQQQQHPLRRRRPSPSARWSS